MPATILRLVVDNPAGTLLEEAERQVARIEDALRQDSNYSGAQLSAPGCTRGCSTCFRKCAVARIQLNWWTKELARLKTGGSIA